MTIGQCSDPEKERERRRKLSESHKGKKQTPETIEKRVAHLRGISRSSEIRALVSEAAKKQWSNPEIRERMIVGIKNNRPDIKGEKNPFFGKTHKKESLELMSESHARTYIEHPDVAERISATLTGRKHDPEIVEKRASRLRGRPRPDIKGKKLSGIHRQNISISLKGRKPSPQSPESLKKMGEKQKELWKNPEHRKKMIKLHIGLQAKEKHPMYGKHHSEETRKKLSDAMMGKLCGPNNPAWTGGPKDYCEKWTMEFKRRIRAWYHYECVECGARQNGKLFHCHHVYYDKKACCSVNEDGIYYSNLGIKGAPLDFEIIGDPNKFVLLCDKCHAKSTVKKNRVYWARHFEEMVNTYYQGKSYLTKEEMRQLGGN